MPHEAEITSSILSFILPLGPKLIKKASINGITSHKRNDKSYSVNLPKHEQGAMVHIRLINSIKKTNGEL